MKNISKQLQRYNQYQKETQFPFPIMDNRTWEEEIYWNNFHFSQFSLTLPSHFHHHLTLPKKFSDYMRAKLPEQILLIVNGLSWNVNLKEDKDGIMLHGDGWEEFTNAYSLKKADVLLFRYDRRECFEVWLFDHASSCEKEASYFVRKAQQKNTNNDDEDEDRYERSEDTTKSLSKGFTDDTSQEEHDDCHYNASGNRHRKKPVRTPKSSSAKTVRSKDVSDDQDESDENSDEENSITEDAKTTPNKVAPTTTARKLQTNASRKRKRNGARKISGKGSTYGVYYKSNRRKVTDAEIKNALRKAMVAAEQCVNSFVVVMKPGCVYKRFFMTIPSQWELRSYLIKGQEVSLRMQGKIWECSISKIRCSLGFNGSRWKTFARDNFLEEHDVCLFVPSASKDERLVLDVSIFRVVPEVVPATMETLP